MPQRRRPVDVHVHVDVRARARAAAVGGDARDATAPGRDSTIGSDRWDRYPAGSDRSSGPQRCATGPPPPAAPGASWRGVPAPSGNYHCCRGARSPSGGWVRSRAAAAQRLGDLGVHVHHRVGEAMHVPRVVEVVVRHDERTDVRGAQAKLLLEQLERVDVLRQAEVARERRVVEAGVHQDPRLTAVPYRVAKPAEAHGDGRVTVNEHGIRGK
eukprot:scaffold6208_cov64-Phaeocystis_antarctica.AAC.4